MSTSYEVTEVTFTPASTVQVERGLIGYLAFRLGRGLLVDGATVRRSLEGRVGIVFPAREDRRGRRHYTLRPVDDATREDLESQIFGALRDQGVLP